MGSLQVPPKSAGRSRFSKALPAIPGFDDNDVDNDDKEALALFPKPPSPVSTSAAATKPGNKALSDLPPPPPPPHNNDPRTPIQFTPLPPIPTTKRSSKQVTSIVNAVPATAAPAHGTTASTSTSITTESTIPAAVPPKMSIPRRPVGSNKQPARKPSVTVQESSGSSQAQTPAPVQVEAGPAPSAYNPQESAAAPLPQQQPQEQPQKQPETELAQESKSEKFLPTPAKRTTPQLPFLPSLGSFGSLGGLQVQPDSEKQEQEQKQEQAKTNTEPLEQVQPKSEADAVAAVDQTLPQPQYASTTVYLDPSQPPQPPISPADSVLGILSAYSRSSTDSVVRSSHGTYSTRDSQPHEEDEGATAATTTAQQAPPLPQGPSSTARAPLIHEPSPSISTATDFIGPSQTQTAQQQPDPAASNVEYGPSSPIPPPPPSKDSEAQRQPDPSSPSTPVLPAKSDLRTRSPPQNQLWTRRTGKGSRDIPDLQLNHSHGSTAATASPAPTTTSQFSTMPIRGLRKPSQTARPAALQTEAAPPMPPSKQEMAKSPPAEQSTIARTMGHGSSKLKQLKERFNKDKFHFSRRSEDESGRSRKNSISQTAKPVLSKMDFFGKSEPAPADIPQPEFTKAAGPLVPVSQPEPVKELVANPVKEAVPAPVEDASQRNRPSAFRPPTPEYQKQDIKTPVIDTFNSPISPASSPEPSKDDSSPDLSKANTEPRTQAKTQAQAQTQTQTQVPPVKEKQPASEEHRPVRPAPPAPIVTDLPAPVAVPALNPAKSLPDLKSRTASPVPTEPFPPLSAFPSSGRNSPARDIMSPRGRPVDTAVRPGTSRASSARPESRRPLDPYRNSGPEPDRLVRSPDGELLYRGRDGTLYPEMKEVADFNPKAAYFPTQGTEPVPDGTIIQAVPLRATHYNCYQGHKSMLRRNNRHYPLACQTCLKADVEDRWVCTFCSLRICESCTGILETNKRDLDGLMQNLAGQTPASLMPSSPAPTGWGLQV